MNKKILIILIILISVFAISQVSASDAEDIISEDLEDATLTMDEDCQITGTICQLENKSFNDIQKAVDDANDGDTIELKGTFELAEGNNTININKTITLVGSDDNTIIKFEDFDFRKYHFSTLLLLMLL